MAVVVTGWKAEGMPLGTVDQYTPPHLDQSEPVNKPEYSGLHAFVASNLQAPSLPDAYKQEYAFAYSQVVYTSPPYSPAPVAPKTETERRILKDKALAYVNVARNVLGHEALTELPKGQAGNASHCVVARAIPEAVAVGSTIGFSNGKAAAKVGQAWGVEINQHMVKTPEALCGFISAFDHGCYPELSF